MKLIYFAWLKERVGAAEEEVDPPADVTTVAELIEWLKERSPGHAAAFADLSLVRVAVNEEYARPEDPIAPGGEVAFFPPVTGG